MPLDESSIMYRLYIQVLMCILLISPAFSVWSQSPSHESPNDESHSDESSDHESMHECDGGLSLYTSHSVPKHGEYDCAERMDTGYVSGDSFPIMVVTVDGEPAERESANAYWVMKQAAILDGIDLHISSAFRTWAEQEYFYNCYLNQNCNNGNLAAAPGYSNHQSGHAFDLNTSTSGVLTWLNNNGARFGFERTVSSEPWHWEWWGGGPGGGPCMGQPCQVIDAAGGVLDDSGPCFQKFGPATYWREVSGEGEGGGLHWTNAFDATSPDNWARWNINISEAGEYLVEVSVSNQYGICTQTPYHVKHAGSEVAVTLNQSSPDYWQPLGTFSFNVGGDQYVDVYDNIPGWSLRDQHITADAVRLTRQRAPDPDPNPDPEPAGEESDPDPITDGGDSDATPSGAMAGEDIGGSPGGSRGDMELDHSAGMRVQDPDDLLAGSSHELAGEEVSEMSGSSTERRYPTSGDEIQDESNPVNTELEERNFQGEVSCAQVTVRSLAYPRSPLSSLSSLLLWLSVLIFISVARRALYPHLRSDIND